MILKTRDKLIEVARQLFANKGVEKTTMNDIAEASDKGRRTIYTYFKNKREIYRAVVDKESMQMLSRLHELSCRQLSPENKLISFIFLRFDAVKEIVMRNGSLRASFFRDVRAVDRVRRITAEEESKILARILQEGVDKGVFKIKHVDETAKVMILSLQGLDVPFIRNNFEDFGIERLRLREYIRNFILYGISAENAPRREINSLSNQLKI